MTAAGMFARFFPRTRSYYRPGMRTHPECVVLGVRDGMTPSARPPVCIFVGTEPAQYRAERVFFWSLEQVRDPSRIYKIYLMKELAGFDRRGWLTGFTNYRFAIPHFAGDFAKAIYNDVDQIYLTDPGELFDTDLDNYGFLAVSERDTSVMLIDCVRMALVWTLEKAQRERRKSLEAKARAVWGPLDPRWNARDEEYVPGYAKLLHYTTIHLQPWQPFPQRYAYQHNPVGQVWLDLEQAANAAGYQVFSSARPSAQYTALLAQLRTACRCGQGDGPQASGWPVPGREPEGLRDLIAEMDARTILDYRLGKGNAEPGGLEGIITGNSGPTLTRYDPVFPSLAEQPWGRFDGVACTEVLEYLPDENVPWIIEELFHYAGRFVHATVTDYSRTRVLPDGTRLRNQTHDLSWWHTHFEAASTRHPEIRWKLVLYTRTAMGRRGILAREGGRRLDGPPTVWVLTDDKPGHTTQSIGLAEALGWPFEVKELHFTALNRLSNRLLGASRISLNRAHSAALTPPWPDLVIVTGRRATPVARWVGKQSSGRTRLVHLGRKGGERAELFDLVVTYAHFRSPPHPRRVETLAPLNPVIAERLAQAAERWQGLFANAPHPRIALLVGGTSALHRLDAETAQRMGEEVRAFAQAAGGFVFATASPRTGLEATEALGIGLGESNYIYRWQPGQQDNPYLAYLALADVLVVTGESESMLAEAAATGKPVYIYPLPERPPGLKAWLKEWVVARAQTCRLNKRGTVRPQGGLAYLCARLIERGLVHPRRDLNVLHQTLVQRGIARFFGEPLDTGNRPPLREIDEVTRRVRALLGCREEG